MMDKSLKMFREKIDAMELLRIIFFLSNFDLDDETTENDTDEKPSREKRLVNAFKQSVSKLYAMFIQYVIPIFDYVDTFLLAEEPLIHILYHSTLRLYCSLLSRFILLEVISESDDVLSIDLEDPDGLKDFKSIFIRAMTKLCARGSEIIGTSEYKKCLTEARAFFTKCAKYLKTSMPVLKNDFIKSLTFLCQPERHQAMLMNCMS